MEQVTRKKELLEIVLDKILQTNSSSHVKQPTTENISIAVSKKSFDSIDKKNYFRRKSYHYFILL